MFSISHEVTTTYALQLLALATLFLAAWLTITYTRVLLLRRRLPPGPFPLPLLGNYFDMRMKRSWIHWEHLANKYEAPLMTLWNGHRPVIVCSDAWTISELFEKRANIYSSRPRMVCMGDLTNTSENNQVCLGYGEKWRLHRRLTHSVVGTQAVKTYRPLQSDESKILLRDILTNPSEYVATIERYSCSVVSIVGWARRIDRLNDQVAQMALALMEVANAVIPGQAIMEVMPWLTKLPSWTNPLPKMILAGATKRTRYFYEMTKESAETVEKRSDVSFSKRLIREKEVNGLSWREVGNMTSNLISGGVDTTSSSIVSFILAMCCFPDRQRKAQEELDRIIGQERMPTCEDEDDLPYITGTVSEVLRWRTVTVLGGLPHAPVQDDEFQGYFVPKDTWIVGNIRAIHRDPRDYPEPDEFRPKRFSNGLERPHPNKKGHSAFGWGRRQCSGQPWAKQGLWLVAARVLWAFEIRPGLDGEGNEIPLDSFAYTASENQRPEPFEARFIPRSTGIEKIILVEADAARERLRECDG